MEKEQEPTTNRDLGMLLAEFYLQLVDPQRTNSLPGKADEDEEDAINTSEHHNTHHTTHTTNHHSNTHTKGKGFSRYNDLMKAFYRLHAVPMEPLPLQSSSTSSSTSLSTSLSLPLTLLSVVPFEVWEEVTESARRRLIPMIRSLFVDGTNALLTSRRKKLRTRVALEYDRSDTVSQRFVSVLIDSLGYFTNVLTEIQSMGYCYLNNDHEH